MFLNFKADEHTVPAVSLDTKIDNHVVSLRSNEAIYNIMMGVCKLFRNTLKKPGFAEIHTPKISSGLLF